MLLLGAIASQKIAASSTVSVIPLVQQKLPVYVSVGGKQTRKASKKQNARKSRKQRK